MSTNDTNDRKPSHGKTIALAPGEVYCRRVKRPLPLAEHERCPYCFGETGEIKTGEHEKFCDFDPEKDPVNFGFPET